MSVVFGICILFFAFFYKIAKYIKPQSKLDGLFIISTAFIPYTIMMVFSWKLHLSVELTIYWFTCCAVGYGVLALLKSEEKKGNKIPYNAIFAGVAVYCMICFYCYFLRR